MSVDETRIAARETGGERIDAVADEGVNAGYGEAGPALRRAALRTRTRGEDRPRREVPTSRCWSPQGSPAAFPGSAGAGVLGPNPGAVLVPDVTEEEPQS